MADNLQATPRNELLGLLSDAMYGGLDWMKDPRRSQQMQGLAGLLESTGIPQTTQRMAYGEPLTNIGRANVPLLKPETADALMNVAPLMPAVGRLASRAVKATEGLPVGMSIKDVSPKIGINVNQGGSGFADKIISGEKKFETRESDSLRAYVGKRVGIIRTGEGKAKAIGDVTLGEPIVISSPEEFAKLRDLHLVPEGSKFDIKKGGVKYLYPIENPVPYGVEKDVAKYGIVSRKILGEPDTLEKALYPQQAALDLAQQRAALPISEGGLGLPANNTPMDRAKAMAGLTKENAMSQAHNIGELEFLSIPNQQFKGKLLYQSPSYSGKKGSVYKLGTLNDEPAYLRQSDHFGGFATNLIEGSPEFKAIEEIQKLETGDIFGRVGKTINEWNLKGGKAELKSQEIENALQEYRNSKTDSNPLGSDKLLDKYLKLKKTGKETGAIPLSELIGRLPEKKYSVVSETGERFEVPMIRMPDGSFRSRFAAFDPFRKDVATATAMGVALPDLLAAEPTPQPQSSGLLYPFP